MSFVKRKLKADPRHKSNVEAEVNETVLTNLSRGLNNIVEFYEIGGKKHSAGGTPLNLPTNDEGPGASFVFSDKLKITDQAVLEMFGSKKKVATYADLSKSHLGVINKSKALLLDKDADEITKKSAEKNIETSMTSLNKLKLLQESEKGFPNGMPSGTESFFKNMGVDPESFLTPSENVEQVFNQAQVKALGGLVRKLPKFALGDEVNTETTGEDPKKKDEAEDPILKEFGNDEDAKEQYLYIKNLKNNPDFLEALWQEYSKIKNNANYYSSGYGKALKDPKKNSSFTFSENEKDKLFDAYLNMQKRNLIFKAQGYDVAATEQSGKKNKSVPEWASKHGVALPSKTDDIAKEQIAYWAFENLVSNKDKYKNLEALKPFDATQRGASDDVFMGKASAITLADGIYTNTSAGQISNFDAKGLRKSKLPFEAENQDLSKEPESKGTVNDLDQTRTILENPYGFRSQDIRNLNRANSSRFSLRRYDPFATVPALKQSDAAYFSPERAIAAIQEQVSSAEDISKAFGDAQGATAGALALSGNAFSATSDVIGNYADKNVGLFTNLAQANTEIASKQSMIDSEIKNQLYNDNVDMDEKFRRGVQMAKDKIAMLTNEAETNASNLYNLNRLTNQIKKDPLTGLVYSTNLKDSKSKDASSVEDFGKDFENFKKGFPADVSTDMLMKSYMMFKTGKIVPDDNSKTISTTEQ